MDAQARVGSIDAIEAFRAALIRFTGRTKQALDDVTGEVKRTRGWLETEQRQKWEGELRRRARAQLLRRQKPADLSIGSRLARAAFGEIVQDFAEAEDAHCRRDDADAIG